jgi:hypothetical protein
MKVAIAVAAAMLALGSASALANRCPAEMHAIDAALPKAKLSEAQLGEVKKLRAEGERLHKAGKHSESTEALDKAKKLLGI